jgi:hypothetical protein
MEEFLDLERQVRGAEGRTTHTVSTSASILTPSGGGDGGGGWDSGQGGSGGGGGGPKPTENASSPTLVPSEVDTNSMKEPETYPYKCESSKCDKTFKTEAKKIAHEKKVHLGPGKYRCEHCSHTSYYSNEHRGHMRSHNANKVNKKFICSLCGAMVRSSFLLECHMKSIHTEERPVCLKCNTSFKNNLELRNHLKNCKTQGGLTSRKRKRNLMETSSLAEGSSSQMNEEMSAEKEQEKLMCASAPPAARPARSMVTFPTR